MKTEDHPAGSNWFWPAICEQHSLAMNILVIAAALTWTGCALNGSRPSAQDLHPKDGRQRVVVLLRVIAEVDGKASPAFQSLIPQDSTWLGLGDFASGGEIRMASQRFLSKDTRKNGWTYLLLEPGIYYLAPHAPQNENAFAYDASWKRIPPCWQLEVPAKAPVVYAGTLFLPGTGQWQLIGDRRLHRFLPKRFEIRDESVLAASLHEAWLQDLGPITTKLVQPYSSTGPIILETPPGR